MNGMQVTYLFMNNKLKTFHIGIIGRFKEANSFTVEMLVFCFGPFVVYKG